MNPVAIFSKSYCPYCKGTKLVLESCKPAIFVADLDLLKDGSTR